MRISNQWTQKTRISTIFFLHACSAPLHLALSHVGPTIGIFIHIRVTGLYQFLKTRNIT